MACQGLGAEHIHGIMGVVRIPFGVDARAVDAGFCQQRLQ
jgi:hypothetical protein